MAREVRATRLVEVPDIVAAPLRFTNGVDLAVTPDKLFEVLADAEAWPHWVSAISTVTWTSPGAADGEIGVGATRTVEMHGGVVGEEVFLDWDPPRTMAFCFARTNAPGMEAFGEHYLVVPTAEGCRLTWTLSMWPTGAQRWFLKLLAPVLDITLSSFLKKLRRYTDRRFS